MEQKQEVDINIKISIDKDGNYQSLTNSLNPSSFEKLKVNLTVAQLAYLLRIVNEMKLIKTNHLSNVIRCITTCISTPKAKNISFDSFKVKFYQPEYATKLAVKDLILRQLNFIQKDLRE